MPLNEQLSLQQSPLPLQGAPSLRQPVHCPPVPQVWPHIQVPQFSVVPQPSLTDPQLRP